MLRWSVRSRVTVFEFHLLPLQLLIDLRFCVPLHTKQIISDMFFSSQSPGRYTVKNIRISTYILRRIFRILFRRFTDTNVYGSGSVKIRKIRHRMSVDMRTFFYSILKC